MPKMGRNNIIFCLINVAVIEVQSDPDLPGPDLPEPRFTGRISFPRNFFGKFLKFCRSVNLHLQFARSNGDHVSARFKSSN